MCNGNDKMKCFEEKKNRFSQPSTVAHKYEPHAYLGALLMLMQSRMQSQSQFIILRWPFHVNEGRKREGGRERERRIERGRGRGEEKVKEKRQPNH